MTDENKIYIKQHNYELASQHDYWTIEEAINYLVAFDLKDKRWKSKEPAESYFAKLFDQVLEMVLKSINNYTLCVRKVTYLEDDPEGPYTATNYHASTVSTQLLVEWAAKRKFKLPDPFMSLLPRFENYQPEESQQPLEESLLVKAESNGLSKDQLPEFEKTDLVKIIDSVFHAVKYCFYQEEGAVVGSEEMSSYLTRSGFGDMPEGALSYVCNEMPEEIRAMTIPMKAAERRSYGALKLQIDNVYKAIEASVAATLHMEGLAEGVKISDDELYDWLHGKGYGALTTRINQKLWQVLPSKHKQSSGAKKYVAKAAR